jgi:hypothetical protein
VDSPRAKGKVTTKEIPKRELRGRAPRAGGRLVPKDGSEYAVTTKEIPKRELRAQRP